MVFDTQTRFDVQPRGRSWAVVRVVRKRNADGAVEPTPVEVVEESRHRSKTAAEREMAWRRESILDSGRRP